jgi:osmoprotectant transport system ATP-binding protein
MIEIDNITKIYDSARAVDGVSMTIDTGTITVIVGTSGSGKTTLLRLINRLEEPTSGEVRINGQSTLDVKPHILRRRIGYAIQGHRVDELLDLFSMAPQEFRHRYPSELSGGQQQRVGVARALASRPELILMDEPFGALDPIIRTRAQEDLRRIQQTLGSTIILVTHDMEEAIRLGDRVAVMDGGKLVQHATPAEIITHPATDFVADMVGDVERPLRLLSLTPLAEVMEDGPANGAPLPREANLRDALSACLWTGRSAVPITDKGKIIGRVTLDAIRARAEVHA